MIPRLLASDLNEALAEIPAVALLGPRQVGIAVAQRCIVI
jgi:hypothetical protein